MWQLCRLLLLRAVTKQLLCRHWTMAPPIEQVPQQRMGGATGTDKEIYKALNISAMMQTEVAFIFIKDHIKDVTFIFLKDHIKDINGKFVMHLNRKTQVNGKEDLLSSFLIQSYSSFIWEDEHSVGGRGVHRSTNKTGGKDDKGDSKGSGRHLCYLALSPSPEYWDWLQAIVL